MADAFESYPIEPMERWIFAGEKDSAIYILRALLPNASHRYETDGMIILRHGSDFHACDREGWKEITTSFLPPTIELVFPEHLEAFDFDDAYDWPFDREGASCRFCICDGAPYQERSIQELLDRARADWRKWPVFMIFENLHHKKLAFTDDPEKQDPLEAAMQRMQEMDIPFYQIDSPESVRVMFYHRPSTFHFFGFSYGRQRIRESLHGMEEWVQSDDKIKMGDVLDAWEKGGGCMSKKVILSLTNYRVISRRTEKNLWKRYCAAGWEHLDPEQGGGLLTLLDEFSKLIPSYADWHKDDWRQQFSKKLHSGYLVALREPPCYSASWNELAIDSDTRYTEQIQSEGSRLFGITGEFRKRYLEFLEKRCCVLWREAVQAAHDEIEQWGNRL